MILKFLRSLGGSGSAKEVAPQPADPVDYEGYVIVATPRQVSGGWSTEGTISRAGAGDGERRCEFVRADTLPSREDAVTFTVRKARQIIDEQGERIFDAERV